ncbi:hypothetical protein CPB84DRAFT_1796587 [Gymnopilus junonius]|uniref:F-box domain-containing protein n=1 Tax=Gymnopilus junonius TaxID=109634 RepID=A0A9P5N8U7_GYMJU|nr:hypothetical protein CPB84DRAFT_1796587 [Gymnopilus junonius]
MLSRVCRSWRLLVLNAPKLWSAFQIEVAGAATATLSLHDLKTMATMRLWLKQSRQYPLSVRLIHIPVGRGPDERSAGLLSALIPEARRWRHVQFIMPQENLAAFHHLPASHFPMLESCTIQSKSFWTSVPSTDVSWPNLPWHQLTSLDLEFQHRNLPSLDKCLNILSQAERLTRCTINSDCSLDPLSIPTENVSLPSLGTLHLILQGGNNMANAGVVGRPETSLMHFLNSLSLPQLHTLRIEWLVQQTEVRTWTAEYPSFLTFLRGVAHNVQTVGLAYLPLTERQLLECLHELPYVTDLELKYSMSDVEHDPITERFLAALTWPSKISQPSDSAPLLPSLQCFNLQCSGKRFADIALLAFLQSRWRVGTRHQDSVGRRHLKLFHLFSLHQVYPEVEKHVHSWNGEGMAVVLDSLVIR